MQRSGSEFIRYAASLHKKCTDRCSAFRGSLQGPLWRAEGKGVTQQAFGLRSSQSLVLLHLIEALANSLRKESDVLRPSRYLKSLQTSLCKGRLPAASRRERRHAAGCGLRSSQSLPFARWCGKQKMRVTAFYNAPTPYKQDCVRSAVNKKKDVDFVDIFLLRVFAERGIGYYAPCSRFA